MKIEDLTLDVEESVEINGAAEDVFKSVLYRFGEGNVRPDGDSLELQIEPWAGGRWYRDRGEGIQHFVGARTSDQTRIATGDQRPDVHVISSNKSC
jgi:hypothetical protein